MNDRAKPQNPAPDPAQLNAAVANAAAQLQGMMQAFLGAAGTAGRPVDPLGLGEAFLQLGTALMRNPEKLWQAQYQAWNDYLGLWADTTGRLLGAAGAGTPAARDRRFRHKAWEENPFFDFIRQSYLITAGAMQGVVASAEGLDEQTARKVQFYTRQYLDALSPTNFALTNPEVLEATLESKGDNLVRGMRNFLEDFDGEKGRLRIRMTDPAAFQLGRNVATTPGKVVFQNDLMQLLQYAPATEQVWQRPLLIIPPWINKYYILDLQPANSLIRWLVEQGHTVFVISWVNPDGKLADKDFGDYLLEGPMAALDAVRAASGEPQVNVIGYCIGGTLLAAALAWMTARGDARIASATFLTTMIDFTEPGDLGVFVDEQQLRNLEESMNERGYHEGSEMATSFNMLRSNDLIWSFFVNNYLLGRDPLPFDLLYWNSDSTRLPARMHSTYLRTMYLENKFKDPGGMVIGGVALDLGLIETPAYFLSTEDDHIAPWRSTFSGARLLGGEVRFVLGKSGHIAGVVNPPAAGKYGYVTGPDVQREAAQWLEAGTAHAGSWWPDWQQWVEPRCGGRVPARQPGDGELPVLEDAPGSYVSRRLED